MSQNDQPSTEGTSAEGEQTPGTNSPTQDAPQPGAAAKAWWEAEDFAGEDYVPGALAAPDEAAPNEAEAAVEHDTDAQAAPESTAEVPGSTPPDAADLDAVRRALDERPARSMDDSGPRTEAMPAVGSDEEALEAEDAPAASSAAEASTVAIERPAHGKANPETVPLSPIAEPYTAPFAATAGAAAGRSAGEAEVDADDTDTAPSPSAPTIKPDDPLGAELASEASLRESLQSKPVFPRILQWVVAILTPLVLLVAAIRAVASGAFLWLDYHRPGFPKDLYGFSDQQRMDFGSYGLNFINSFVSGDYLGGLRTPEGAQTLGGASLFRAEEVAHMVDVQRLVHLAYLIAVVAALIMAISFLVLRARYSGGIRRGLFAGAWVTLGLISALSVLGALGWQRFFTDFHRLFFSGGNWEFFLDDTLIRLYPPQFWMDAAITLAGLVLLAVVVILCLTWPTRTRRERSKLRQTEREFRLG